MFDSDVAMSVASNYSGNFLITLEMSLISCEVNLYVTLSPNFFYL